MEKVINVLSEIEDKASKILDRTKEQKQQLYEQLNKDLAKLETDIKTETNHTLDIMNKDMESSIAKEKANLIDDCDKQLVKLQADYDASHDKISDSIFQKIIEV